MNKLKSLYLYISKWCIQICLFGILEYTRKREREKEKRKQRIHLYMTISETKRNETCDVYIYLIYIYICCCCCCCALTIGKSCQVIWWMMDHIQYSTDILHDMMCIYTWIWRASKREGTKFRRGCCDALPLSWRRCKLDYNNNNYNFIIMRQQQLTYTIMEIRNSTLKIVLHAFKPLCACIFTLASLISRKYPIIIIIHRIPDKIYVYSSHVIKNNTHFHKLKKYIIIKTYVIWWYVHYNNRINGSFEDWKF